MRALWMLPLAIGLCLLSVGAIVLGFRDQGILVSPPEAVAEDFFHKLARHRYVRAHADLDDQLASRTSVAELRRLTESLEKELGGIEDAKGKVARMEGDVADAEVLLKTRRAGDKRVKLKLSRSEGSWSISGLGALSAGLSAAQERER